MLIQAETAMKKKTANLVMVEKLPIKCEKCARGRNSFKRIIAVIRNHLLSVSGSGRSVREPGRICLFVFFITIPGIFGSVPFGLTWKETRKKK